MKTYFNVYCNGKKAWSCTTKKEAQKAVAMMKQCRVHANDEITIERGALYE